MMRTYLSLLATLLWITPLASADIIYHVTATTSTIAGTAGSLEFQFAPGGLVTQGAFLDIMNFNSDGALVGGAMLSGDVTGALPATVTFDNGTSFNDYFQDFTFGASLEFDVRLYGPAVNTPDGTSTSGSTFGFSMYSDQAGTIPALTTDPLGFAATIDLNLDGTGTVNSSSTQTTVAPSVNAVPEPSSLALLAAATLGAIFRRRRGLPG